MLTCLTSIVLKRVLRIIILFLLTKCGWAADSFTYVVSLCIMLFPREKGRRTVEMRGTYIIEGKLIVIHAVC